MFFLTPMAEGAHHSVNRHYQKGMDFLSQGRKYAAVEEFVRGLLVSPQDLRVQNQIQKLCRESNGLTVAQRRELDRFLDLINYLNFTTERLRHFRSSNQNILAFIRQRDAKLLQPFSPDMNPADFREQVDGDLNGTLNIRFSKIFLREGRLDRLNASLEQKKNADIARLKELQHLHEQLWGIKQKLILRQASLQNNILTEDVRHKNGVIRHQQDTIINLQEQMKSVQGEFKSLQIAFLRSQRDIRLLTRDIAALSLEIFAKDRQLANQQQNSADLETRIFDAQQRLELVQRIMREKDRSIQTLSARLNVPAEAVTGPDAPSPSLSDASAVYKNRNQLLRLERQLQELRRKNQTLNQTIKNKTDMITHLQHRLQHRDMTIAEMQSRYRIYNKKMTELTGIIDIYQQKLNQTTRQLKANQDLIMTMKHKLLQLNIAGQTRLPSMPSEPRTFKRIHLPETAWPLSQDQIYRRTKKSITGLMTFPRR